jgi:hypothetical protein
LRARTFALAVGVGLLVAAPARASGEISDPCGPGSGLSTGGVPEKEPLLPWLDICGADVDGIAGSGSLRGVRTVIHLDGDVASGRDTGSYAVGLVTDRCYMEMTYTVYPQPDRRTAHTELGGTCDYRTVPCSPPEDALPFASCGTQESFHLVDPPAATVAIAGSSVRFTLDPNALAAGSVPASLLGDFQPGRQLRGAAINAMLGVGSDEPRASAWLGADSAATTATIPLGG